MRAFVLCVLLCSSASAADWSQYAERSIDASHDVQVSLHRELVTNLWTRKGIPFNTLMSSQCGAECRPQAHSLAVFLIQKGGRKRLLDCIREARLQNLSDRWARVFRRHYGFASLSELQLAWLAWVQENQHAEHLTVCPPGGT